MTENAENTLASRQRNAEDFSEKHDKHAGGDKGCGSALEIGFIAEHERQDEEQDDRAQVEADIVQKKKESDQHAKQGHGFDAELVAFLDLTGHELFNQRNQHGYKKEESP